MLTIKSLLKKTQQKVFFILLMSMCVHHYLEFMPQMSGSKCRTLFNRASTSLDKLEHGFKKPESTGH